jgi:hypothetical protein
VKARRPRLRYAQENTIHAAILRSARVSRWQNRCLLRRGAPVGKDGAGLALLGLAVGPFRRGVDHVCAHGVDVFDPERCGAVEDVVEDCYGDENVCCGSALEIKLLALLVPRWVHGGREIDHPCEDGLDECVVQQVHGETDAAEEVEHGRCEYFACSRRKEDTNEHGGST